MGPYRSGDGLDAVIWTDESMVRIGDKRRR